MLEEMDMDVSFSLGARPVIWRMHIHKCPKRKWITNSEHIVCRKWPKEDNEYMGSRPDDCSIHLCVLTQVCYLQQLHASI